MTRPAPTAHLVLIGLMGVGKTTVGRRLARRLGRPFADSDAIVEQRTGRTVRELVAERGEAAMRAAEADALRSALAADTPSVIGCAAGVVLDPAHRDLLRSATVVWLRGDPAVLATRAVSGAHRPWLEDDPAATLGRMHAERTPLYESVADLVVDVTPDGAAGHPDQVAAAIADWFEGAPA